MRNRFRHPGMAVLACGSFSIALVLVAQMYQPPVEKQRQETQAGTTEQPGGKHHSPVTVPNPVTAPSPGPAPQQPPPTEPPGAPPAPGAAPGTFPSPGPAATRAQGLTPGTPQTQGTGGGVGVVQPQLGVPAGNVLGPGGTVNPAGVPEPYAKGGPEQYLFMAAPDPARGKQLISEYGCGTCHTIDQIRSARGMVGPPLTNVASRVYIAGVLQNTMENRARWIENPQRFVPNVVMPNLGLSRADAEDISAYLESLKYPSKE
ncbi:MAG: cytochrome c [Acidobacteria bacterium]|nr:cytochrome c [Acidobacteriota bacterium]